MQEFNLDFTWPQTSWTAEEVYQWATQMKSSVYLSLFWGQSRAWSAAWRPVPRCGSSADGWWQGLAGKVQSSSPQTTAWQFACNMWSHHKDVTMRKEEFVKMPDDALVCEQDADTSAGGISLEHFCLSQVFTSTEVVFMHLIHMHTHTHTHMHTHEHTNTHTHAHTHTHTHTHTHMKQLNPFVDLYTSLWQNNYPNDMTWCHMTWQH